MRKSASRRWRTGGAKPVRSLAEQALPKKTESDLSTAERLLLMGLAQFLGIERDSGEYSCFPSLKTISRTTGLSRSTIKRALKRLEDRPLPLIRTSRPESTNGHEHESYRFTLSVSRAGQESETYACPYCSAQVFDVAERHDFFGVSGTTYDAADESEHECPAAPLGCDVEGDGRVNFRGDTTADYLAAIRKMGERILETEGRHRPKSRHARSKPRRGQSEPGGGPS